MNEHHAVTSGRYRSTDVVDTPVSPETRHSGAPRRQEWLALLCCDINNAVIVLDIDSIVQ